MIKTDNVPLKGSCTDCRPDSSFPLRSAACLWRRGKLPYRFRRRLGCGRLLAAKSCGSWWRFETPHSARSLWRWTTKGSRRERRAVASPVAGRLPVYGGQPVVRYPHSTLPSTTSFWILGSLQMQSPGQTMFHINCRDSFIRRNSAAGARPRVDRWRLTFANDLPLSTSI